MSNLFLKERWLWFKHFGAIAFVHKPLCEHYGPHYFKFKGVYVCRGCFFLWIGIAGAVGGLVFALDVLRSFTTGVCAGVLLVWILSHPTLYARLPKLVCYGVRILLGASLVVPIGFLLVREWGAGVSLIAIVLVAKFIYGRIRYQSMSRICESCNEYRCKPICSGFNEKYRRIKAYERELEEEIRGQGLRNRK